MSSLISTSSNVNRPINLEEMGRTHILETPPPPVPKHTFTEGLPDAATCCACAESHLCGIPDDNAKRNVACVRVRH